MRPSKVKVETGHLDQIYQSSTTTIMYFTYITIMIISSDRSSWTFLCFFSENPIFLKDGPNLSPPHFVTFWRGPGTPHQRLPVQELWKEDHRCHHRQIDDDEWFNMMMMTMTMMVILDKHQVLPVDFHQVLDAAAASGELVVRVQLRHNQPWLSLIISDDDGDDGLVVWVQLRWSCMMMVVLWPERAISAAQMAAEITLIDRNILAFFAGIPISKPLDTDLITSLDLFCR